MPILRARKSPPERAKCLAGYPQGVLIALGWSNKELLAVLLPDALLCPA